MTFDGMVGFVAGDITLIGDLFRIAQDGHTEHLRHDIAKTGVDLAITFAKKRELWAMPMLLSMGEQSLSLGKGLRQRFGPALSQGVVYEDEEHMGLRGVILE